MTPYLILDNEMVVALSFAAQRGIDVKLILPHVPDKKIVFYIARTYYKQLMEAGVKIYEYEPGFIHAKTYLADDKFAIVGTINLDYRSLYHHFECATYMFKTDCIADIERDFLDTLKECRRVTTDSIRNEKLSYKVTGSLAKMISPLM